MNSMLAIFVSEVHILDVEFFWVDAKSRSGELVAPRLENLGKLW